MICFNIIMILWYKIPKYNTRFKRRTKFSKLPLYFPYSCRKLEEFLFVFFKNRPGKSTKPRERNLSRVRKLKVCISAAFVRAFFARILLFSLESNKVTLLTARINR